MHVMTLACGLVLAIALASGAPVRAADDINAPVEISIAPFLPTALLVQNYQPLVNYLEQRLQRRVLLVTAPDYRTYNERILRREYGFLIAVASSASLAISDAGYAPLLRPAVYTHPALVVRKNSTVRGLGDLKNAKVATTDAMGIIAMQGAAMLRESGLDPPRDVSLQNFANHGVAVNYVLTGEMGAAIISDRALMQMPDSKRDELRVLHVWEKGGVPGVVYLAGQDVSADTVTRVREAILEFARDTEAGRELMSHFGYGALLPTQVDDLKFLVPYGAQLKALLGHSP